VVATVAAANLYYYSLWFNVLSLHRGIPSAGAATNDTFDCLARHLRAFPDTEVLINDDSPVSIPPLAFLHAREGSFDFFIEVDVIHCR
jgi:hypothetical protein